jgi:hypothetical protein
MNIAYFFFLKSEADIFQFEDQNNNFVHKSVPLPRCHEGASNRHLALTDGAYLAKMSPLNYTSIINLPKRSLASKDITKLHKISLN